MKPHHLSTTGWACALVSLLGLLGSAQAGLVIHVSPTGNDRWTGRTAKPDGGDGPVATLQRARDLIRGVKRRAGLPPGGFTVLVHGNLLPMAAPLELTDEDSGERRKPICYRAAPGARPELSGGRVVSGFRPVTDPTVLARLTPEARAHVVTADLKALGVSDFGSPAGGGIELFWRHCPMTLARWPNSGFVKIADVIAEKPVDVRGTKGDRAGKFVYEGDRPARWTAEPDGWLEGYWFWDWSDQRMKVKSIDTAKKVIALADPQHGYGYRKGQWYYAFNMLCELDEPGEWYVDRAKGVLYFWPPAPPRDGDTVVSVLPTLLTMKDVSYVSFKHLGFEAARETAVTIEGGRDDEIVGCTLRNLGKSAVAIRGGTHHRVAGCDVCRTGAGGISADGGERKSLTPAGHVIENNHVYCYGRWWRMYSSGISINGVGQVVQHNLIDNAPHIAIFFGGNDHLIQYNEIHSVCLEANDAGAIYAGRDWTMRGTVIRYNYLHDIAGYQGRGCVGVYLDDMFSGTRIEHNLFYRVTMAAFIGGGRDCTIEGNCFVDCRPSVHVDARGLGWAKGSVPTTMKTRLEAMPYRSELWQRRYPGLLNTWDDDPGAPKGNVIAHNISYGGKWDSIEGKARPLVLLDHNLLEGDPGFLMPHCFAAGRNPRPQAFALRPDSPAFAMGFKALPLKLMGLRHNPDRARWAAPSPVQPIPVPPPRQPRAAKGPQPVAAVKRIAQQPRIDGQLYRAELFGMSVLSIAQGIEGETLKPVSTAWLGHDGQYLYVLVDNEVNPAEPLKIGHTWGQDDAVELALRDPFSKGKPIVLLRGYADGTCSSSDESGAAPAVVARAAKGVAYAAKVQSASQWIAEFKIPLAALGIDLSKQRRYAFNLSVRKTGGPAWMMWRGTGAHTWDVDTAGFIELAP